MKLIIAIVNSEDASAVLSELTGQGFSVTKLATSGGFLRAGNVTILIGLEDSRLDEAMDLIRKYSNTRKQIIPTTANLGVGFHPAMPVEVTVGGATVFVLNVEQFEKL